jgi:membrane fusion protein, multidrug efflux system
LIKYIKWAIALALIGGIAVTAALIVQPATDGDGSTAFKGGNKGKGKGRRRPAGGEVVPVVAEKAVSADVPVYLDGLGTVRALNTVTVQPLVDGRLIGVKFREGHPVAKGELLATIDPTLYQAQLDQAVAKKAQDEAQLASARRELERASSVGRIATLQKTIDTTRAQVEQFEALVKADQAAIDNATAQLGYTRIIAPIAGRTGIRMVDEGNVVRASANSALVVITQVQPISILFNLPQQQLGRVNAAMANAQTLGGAEGRWLIAEALGPDGKTVIERGELKVVDNQVDQTTGTVRLKAEFPNAKLQLWPGQFVSVRVLVETLKGATVLPTAAVQQGPDGSFVYVVGEEDRVAVRQVTVAQQDDRFAVIGTGVKTGESVVTTGFARLRDGSRVTLAAPGNPGNPGNGKALSGRGQDGTQSRRRSGRKRETPAEGQSAERAQPQTTGKGSAAASGEGSGRREGTVGQ